MLSRLTPWRKNLPFAFHPGFIFFPSPLKSSSCRTQAASVAYLEEPCTKKVRHHCNRHVKRKYKKQNQLLSEVVVPAHIQKNLLANHDVEKDILVFDGGYSNNPPFKPPDGVNWQLISISEEKYIVALDHNDPNCGLPYACFDDTRPFICMPWVLSQSILGDRDGRISIQNDLNACERLRKYGDYGTPPMYTCAGLQVSQNSCDSFLFVIGKS